MGQIYRWLLLFFAALVLTAVFQPPLIALLEKWGWYSSPSQVAGDVVNWLSDLVGEAAFPWVASATLGAAIGAWGDYLALRRDRSRVSPADRFRDLHFKIKSMRSSMLALFDTWAISGIEARGFWSGSDGGSYFALSLDMKKLSIAMPDAEIVCHPSEYKAKFEKMVTFLDFLASLAASGHIKKARSLSREFTNEFNAKFRSANDVEVIANSKGVND